LERAARDLNDWQRYFPLDPPLSVSVNVSRRQFRDPQFLSLVEGVLSNNEIAPGTLKLEITESAISTGEDAKKILSRLQSLNLGLAIDDFGTGLSTLGQLKDIPFDLLKIDKSFLSTSERAAEGEVILGSMVALAKELKRDVVIEGVETEDDLSRAKAAGCEFVQGFYYSVALSSADALNFIAHHYGVQQAESSDADRSSASGVSG
jgi:EAL domain-containing protein (putative c-di-GMP-specific phosphodiesterase class I)